MSANLSEIDMILRNQISVMSGIAALLEKTRGSALTPIIENLDSFAIETTNYLCAKHNKPPFITAHDAAKAMEERAWPDDLEKP